jgi:hypothetical protein
MYFIIKRSLIESMTFFIWGIYIVCVLCTTVASVWVVSNTKCKNGQPASPALMESIEKNAVDTNENMSVVQQDPKAEVPKEKVDVAKSDPSASVNKHEDYKVPKTDDVP